MMSILLTVDNCHIEIEWISYHSVRSSMNNINSEIKGEYCEKSVDEPDGRDGTEEDEPEVEEDVDLFIDNVEWENTEGIMVLH